MNINLNSSNRPKSKWPRKPINLIPLCDHFTVNTKQNKNKTKDNNNGNQKKACRRTKVALRVLMNSHMRPMHFNELEEIVFFFHSGGPTTTKNKWQIIYACECVRVCSIANRNKSNQIK